jgi:integrase
VSVIARKRKSKTTYYVVFRWQGRAVWENAGHDRRAAERLDRQRAREVQDDTYHPTEGSPTGHNVAQWAESWLKRREVRSVKDEERWLRKHVLTRPWFATLLLVNVKPHHFDRIVRELKGTLSDKSIANVVGVLSVMFRDAHRKELIPGNPVNLEPGLLKRTPQTERATFTAAEVSVLCSHASIPEHIRVLSALCLLGGLREGEACGRRWRDLDTSTAPLWCLSVHDQYDDKPLKTDRPRLVPVHPELAAILERWGRGGYQLWACKPPEPDDFVVPAMSKRSRSKCWTRSMFYKAFVRACSGAGARVGFPHEARHTFTSLCRRGGARKDVLERVTHNAKGDIVDRYTHWDWAPLCEAVACLRLTVDARQLLHLPAASDGKDGSDASLLTTSNAAETPLLTPGVPGSIPGASTLEQHKNRTGHEPRQLSRQRGPGRRRSSAVVLETPLGAWHLAAAYRSAIARAGRSA